MPDDRLRRTQYLESLARLQPSWVHESRSHLGNVSLQLDLLGELLPGADGVADATRLPNHLYLSGSYARQVHTLYGTLPEVRVPKLRAANGG